MKNLILNGLLIVLFNAAIAQKQPNIVWIVAEDMSPHLGSYGEKVAKTPFLDQFAKESVRYTNVFSTAGVCAPSRAALITGMYQTSIGAQHMRVKKSLNAPEYYPANFKEYEAVLPEGVLPYPILLRKAGYYCTNNSKTDYQFEAPVCTWDENGSNASYQNRKDKSQPFFSIFNIMTSHEGKVHQLAHLPLLVNPVDVQVPPYYPDNEVIRNDIARFLTNVMRMDEEVGEIIEQLKQAGEYDNTIIFFYADHGDGLPYVKREILDRGLRVPLLVKHPQGKFAGTTNDRKISFIDFAPTLFSLANVPIPGFVNGKAFLGNKATAEGHPYIFAARDRMDSEYDQARSVHDGRFQYILNYYPNLPRYQHIISRLKQPMMAEILRLKNENQLDYPALRWFESKSREELYDLQQDPYQLNDLAKDKNYQTKLNELRSALKKWSEKYDPYANTAEMEMVNGWWNGKDKMPITEQPAIKKSGNKIILTCATKGAVISYRFSESEPWKHYDNPIEGGAKSQVQAVAHRIGWQPSDIILQP